MKDYSKLGEVVFLLLSLFGVIVASPHSEIIVVMGDSTSARLADALALRIRDCSLQKTQERCDFAFYYGTPYSLEKLGKPIPKGYGPTAYGRTHRGCQDCAGCGSKYWTCHNNTIVLEYIGIEFAIDVEYPTEEYDTTQESIIQSYLKKYQSRIKYLYFNTGLHDAGIDAKMKLRRSHLSYRKNLNFTLRLLLNILDPNRLVWMTSTSVLPQSQPKKWRKITNNKKIGQFNQISVQTARELGISSIDLFKLSKESKYRHLNRDGIHWGESYEEFYQEVAQIVGSKSQMACV